MRGFSRPERGDSGYVRVQMTRDLMAAGHLLQHGFDLGTDRLGEGTARMKAAARGRIERTGYLTGQDDFFALFIGVRWQGGRKETLAVWMKGFHPQLLAGSEFDNFTEIHHRYGGTQVQDGC